MLVPMNLYCVYICIGVYVCVDLRMNIAVELLLWCLWWSWFACYCFRWPIFARVARHHTVITWMVRIYHYHLKESANKLTTKQANKRMTRKQTTYITVRRRRRSSYSFSGWATRTLSISLLGPSSARRYLLDASQKLLLPYYIITKLSWL